MMKSSRIYSGLQEKLMTSNLRSNITPIQRLLGVSPGICPLLYGSRLSLLIPNSDYTINW